MDDLFIVGIFEGAGVGTVDARRPVGSAVGTAVGAAVGEDVSPLTVGVFVGDKLGAVGA